MSHSHPFPPSFNPEPSDMNSLIVDLDRSLKFYHLSETYSPEEIIVRACSREVVVASNDCSGCHEEITPNSFADPVPAIQLSWLKTTCLEIIKNLSQQRENRQKFDTAIQALLDMNNPDSQSIWANVSRTLRQYRLSGTYEVREIIAEAYSIGVKRIESGVIIENPLAWLRGTCLNVIRDFRRKQDRIEKPKLDGEGLTAGDEVLSNLIIAEDHKAIRLALARLTPEEQQILCIRVLEGLSWQEIGGSLSCSQQLVISANTARQRGFRALQRLRQHYDAIRQAVEMDDDGNVSIDANTD